MNKRVFGSGLLILATSVWAGGCGQERGTPLSPARSERGFGVPQATATAYTLTVIVQGVDLAFLPGARAEVVGGMEHEHSLGAFCVTDADGRCTFSQPFTVQPTPQVRVTRDGFIPYTLQAARTAEGNALIRYIKLTPTAPPQSFAGEYVLRLIASRSCANLPAELQTVTVNATIVQNDYSIHIVPERTSPSCASFYGGTAGDSIGVYSDPDCGGVLKFTGSDTAILAAGTLRATRSGSTLKGYLDGQLAEGSLLGWFYELVGGCRASDHALTLTPR